MLKEDAKIKIKASGPSEHVSFGINDPTRRQCPWHLVMLGRHGTNVACSAGVEGQNTQESPKRLSFL